MDKKSASVLSLKQSTFSAEKSQLMKQLNGQLCEKAKRGVYSTARTTRKLEMFPTLQSNVYKIINNDCPGVMPHISSSEKILMKLNSKFNHQYPK
jgi:hypothetical protein